MTAKTPDDIRRFILVIPSVPYLETVLLMRESPNEAWDTRKVAARLFLNEDKIAGMLPDLCNTGICVALEDQVDHYVYRPHSPDLAQLIDRVAAYYARNLIEVSNMIHSTSGTHRIQQFADAFHWRKGRDK